MKLSTCDFEQEFAALTSFGERVEFCEAIHMDCFCEDMTPGPEVNIERFKHFLGKTLTLALTTGDVIQLYGAFGGTEEEDEIFAEEARRAILRMIELANGLGDIQAICESLILEGRDIMRFRPEVALILQKADELELK